MKEKILKLIINAVNEINLLLENKIPVENGETCLLYGKEGILDSLSLVSLIVLIEESIENNFNANLILANEKAMSQRNSPFLTIGSLANYIETLLREESCNV